MKNRQLFYILCICLVLVSTSGCVVTDTLFGSKVDITIETDGNSVNVTADSNIFNRVPNQMKQDILNYVLMNIKGTGTTVDTIKYNTTVIAHKYNYTDVNVNIKSQFGENELPMTATVKGTSMVPTLQDGQTIVVHKTKNYKVGDIVISNHDVYGLIVKRVGKINSTNVYLMSDNKKIEKNIQNNYIVTKTPINTWVPNSYIIGVVKEY